ncbi:restriction endonuclease subunit S [Gluconacetobacter sp. Hr-1-5]|uniref:restriction endonuclease subunit S n=1 Tax=Gluconacetobacter sp. Hr-1-5 TaxID=3395370 RepID=UPI003B52BAC5
MKTLAEAIGGAKRIIGGPFGSKLTTRDYSDCGVPVIRGSNMEINGRWVGGEFAYVSQQKLDRDLATNVARPGNIIVTQRGTLGQVSIIPDKSVISTYVVSQSQMAIDIDHKIANRDFVYYYLRSSEFTEHSQRQTIQTGVPHINLGILREAPATFPPLCEQHEIATTLGALDNKIELNRKTAATLEEMARALYRSWFVDFDPVYARAESRAPSHMDAATAALFPDTFGENGLPMGWRISSIGQELEILDSRRIPLSKTQRAQKAGNIPYYGATSIMDYVNQPLFDEELLLIGEDGSVVRSNGTPFTQYIWGPSWVNNHAHVLKGRRFSVPQLKCYFDQAEISGFVNGAVQAKLNQANMKKIPFVEAPPNVHSAFDAAVVTWFAGIRLAIDQNRTLASLRDTLLPRLMSGELRVPAAREMIEEIA